MKVTKDTCVILPRHELVNSFPRVPLRCNKRRVELMKTRSPRVEHPNLPRASDYINLSGPQIQATRPARNSAHTHIITLLPLLPLAAHFVCLFVCWVNKTRAVKPLRRFHSWILSFTQDGPAFSTFWEPFWETILETIPKT